MYLTTRHRKEEPEAALLEKCLWVPGKAGVPCCALSFGPRSGQQCRMLQVDVSQQQSSASPGSAVLGQGMTDPAAFRAAVQLTRMPMVLADPNIEDCPVVYCNDAFCDMTGYERAEILGRNCRFLQGPEKLYAK